MSIPYGAIAGGKPSVTTAMVKHLMNNTLGLELTEIAAYFSRGDVSYGLERSGMLDIAHAIAAGQIDRFDAVDLLMEEWTGKHPPPSDQELSDMDTEHSVWQETKKGGRWVHTEGWRDLESEWQARFDKTERKFEHHLDVLTDRIKHGLLHAPLAVVREDSHPRALSRLGIPEDKLLTDKEVSALLAGRHADGGKIVGKRYIAPRPNSDPIGSYDFIPSPDKSVSVAWAFAPPAEQAQIAAAHLEAARDAMREVARIVGVVRLGAGGMGGTEPGHVIWLEFTHHTDRQVPGERGDPGLHTHFVIPNAVFSESGKVGSLHTAALRQAMHTVNRYYHASLEHRLRTAGFETHMDEKTGVLKMGGVPPRAETQFSKRTVRGEKAARERALNQGEIWDALSVDQKSKRTKDAVQDREQKIRGGRDDVADFAGWKQQARDVGWEPPLTMKLYGPPTPEPQQARALRERFGAAVKDSAAAMLARMAEIRSNATALFQSVLQRGAEKARHALIERRMRRVLAMGIRPRGPKNERGMGM